MSSILQLPWDSCVATGVGSLPYDSAFEAARVAFGETPDLPFLPELPGRGPGSSIIGRGIAVLEGLGADLQPSGWRLTSSSGRGTGLDQRRARELLSSDLEAFALAGTAAGHGGPVKIQITGPLTLAASVSLPSGRSLLRDAAARRDLAQSLAAGVSGLLSSLSSWSFGTVVLQVDEPSLPSVLGGGIPTESGLTSYAPIGESEAAELLGAVLGVSPLPIVHCCAPGVPVPLLTGAGACGIAFDFSLVSSAASSGRGFDEAIDAGVAMFAGLLPTTRPSTPLDSVAVAKGFLSWWRSLGFDAESAARQVVVTPACGLGLSTPDWTRDALVLARETAEHLATP